MLTNEQAQIIATMLSEHIEGHNQQELMHFAREKKWSEADLKMALDSIINIVLRRDN